LATAAAFAHDAPDVDAFVGRLAKLKTYEPGQSRELLNDIQLRTVEAARDPASRTKVAEAYARMLGDGQATAAARRFACRQLQTVGTEAQVPLLTKLLADPKLADLARGALERIPGEASLKVLNDALASTRGAVCVGVINSLGLRRDGGAVTALAELLKSGDEATVNAALTALGRIATPEAGCVLLDAKSTPPSIVTLQDSQLRCAERLGLAGNKSEAVKIYRHVWKTDRPTPWRVSALSGLVRVAGDEATPMVLEALESDDPLCQAMAMGLARQLPGAKLTEALVQRLAKLDPDGQVLLLDVLAERADPSAAGAVRKLAEGENELVRAAAFRAMVKLADADSVAWLTQRAATEKGVPQRSAREALAKLTAEGADEQLIALMAKGESGPRAEAIRALEARRVTKAATPLLKQAEESDAGIRNAALQALGVLAGSEAYPALLKRVIALAPTDSSTAETALLAVAGRIEQPGERSAPVIAALKGAAPPVRAALLRVLGALGGAEALAAVRSQLDDGDAAVRDAAVRALAGSTDPAVAPDLLKLAQKAESPVHRVLSVRGYLRLIAASEDANARMKMLADVKPLATTTDFKKMLLGGLGDVTDGGALGMAAGFLDDAEVKAEAAMAVLKIGEALVGQDRTAVAAAMVTLIEKAPDDTVRKRARDLLKQAERGPKAARGSGLKADRKRSAATKAAKAQRPPKGFRLVSYLDCGPDLTDDVKSGPSLRITAGTAHAWDQAARTAPVQMASVAYDAKEVTFEANGLDPKKNYRLGFSWWDYDHGDRAESVWVATGQGRQSTKVLEKTALPSFSARKEKPVEKTVTLPRPLHADGRLRISFRNEGGANAVVSEVWLWESEAEGGKVEAPARSQTSVPVPAPETKAAARAAPPANPNAEARVVLQTGNEYPGHKWKLTAPALADVLRKDGRLDVQVIEDPAFMASPDLKKFKVIVLNYMNWKTPDPGEAARKNLKETIAGGTGLVMVHFACGAYQGWPEFVKIAGRVWNPKMRGHDKFGKFSVEIAKEEHPIMKGLKAFETTDELYTCLDGGTPIEILATATSKVDKKVYPMAFVLTYGKGRIVVFSSHPDGYLEAARMGSPADAVENVKLMRNAILYCGGM